MKHGEGPGHLVEVSSSSSRSHHRRGIVVAASRRAPSLPAVHSSRLTKVVGIFLLLTIMFVAVPSQPASAVVDPAVAAASTANGQLNNDADKGWSCGDQDDITSGIGDALANNAFCVVQSWILQVPHAAVSFMLRMIDFTTTPNLSDKNGWFRGQYSLLYQMAIWVLFPLVLISIIHGIAKGSLGQILRTMFVYTPLAILGSVVALQFVQLLLMVTDDFCKTFTSSIKVNSDQMWSGILGNFGINGIANQIPPLLLIILALLLGFAAMGVILILLVRDVAVELATLFLPLGFACMVWPGTFRFFRRIVEFVIAMILSKLIIVAGISLAVASLTASTFEGSNNPMQVVIDGSAIAPVSSTGDDVGFKSDTGIMEWWGDTIASIVMLGIVCFAPNAAAKFVGNVVSPDLAGSIGGNLNRLSAMRQLIFLDRLRNSYAIVRTGFGHVKQIGSNFRGGQGLSLGDQALSNSGVFRNSAGNFHLDRQDFIDAMLVNGHLDAKEADMWAALSRSKNATNVRDAHMALAMMRDGNYGGVIRESGHWVSGPGGSRVWQADPNIGTTFLTKANAAGEREAIVAFDIQNPTTGAAVVNISQNLAARAAHNAFNARDKHGNSLNVTGVRGFVPLAGSGTEQARSLNNVNKAFNRVEKAQQQRNPNAAARTQYYNHARESQAGGQSIDTMMKQPLRGLKNTIRPGSVN